MTIKLLIITLILSSSFGSLMAQENAKSLPAIPNGKGEFHAYYTRLNYTKEWEKPWRVGEFADVVVSFPDLNTGFVFWRGASYIPNWVTENGIWYNNQFVERISGGIKETKGCVEPMSDKQCRYSQVRIIEDNEARKIIHWRYAPVDVQYHHPYVDPENGWFDWVDEYYVIYPDAVSVREATLYSTEVNAFADWQESIIIHQPGRSPEADIDTTAVSISNIKGETTNYYWPEASKKMSLRGLPDKPCIQVVNLKSQLKPFIVVPPDTGLTVRLFTGQGTHSIFRQWDHWPVSQDKSDGRDAKDDSNPSHTSLTYWKGWKPTSTTENSTTFVMLAGMTDQKAGELASLAKSWLSPAAVKIETSAGLTFNGFDQSEKAYVFTDQSTDKSKKACFEVNASSENPLVNPAFTIRNWKGTKAKIKIKGATQKIEEMKQGIEYGIAGNTLVVWVKAKITVPIRISIEPLK
jgi:hypothetical protein